MTRRGFRRFAGEVAAPARRENRMVVGALINAADHQGRFSHQPLPPSLRGPSPLLAVPRLELTRCRQQPATRLADSGRLVNR